MINNLINTLSSGARSNKYRITIPFPNIKDIDVLVQSTTFPSKTITPVDILIRGRKVSLRGETNLENTWDITFYNNKDMIERKIMLDWLNLVHTNQWNPDTGFLSNALSGVESLISGVKNVIENPMSLISGGGMTKYQKDIKIEQLDNSGSSTFSTTLIGAFPINVSNIELSDQETNVSQTTVTFAFSDIKYDIKGDGIQFEDIKDLINNI